MNRLLLFTLGALALCGFAAEAAAYVPEASTALLEPGAPGEAGTPDAQDVTPERPQLGEVTAQLGAFERARPDEGLGEVRPDARGFTFEQLGVTYEQPDVAAKQPDVAAEQPEPSRGDPPRDRPSGAGDSPLAPRTLAATNPDGCKWAYGVCVEQAKAMTLDDIREGRCGLMVCLVWHRERQTACRGSYDACLASQARRRRTT